MNSTDRLEPRRMSRGRARGSRGSDPRSPARPGRAHREARGAILASSLPSPIRRPVHSRSRTSGLLLHVGAQRKCHQSGMALGQFTIWAIATGAATPSRSDKPGSASTTPDRGGSRLPHMLRSLCSGGRGGAMLLPHGATEPVDGWSWPRSSELAGRRPPDRSGALPNEEGAPASWSSSARCGHVGVHHVDSAQLVRRVKTSFCSSRTMANTAVYGAHLW